MLLDQNKTIVKAEKGKLILFGKKIDKPYFALLKTSKKITVMQNLAIFYPLIAFLTNCYISQQVRFFCYWYFLH